VDCATSIGRPTVERREHADRGWSSLRHSVGGFEEHVLCRQIAGEHHSDMAAAIATIKAAGIEDKDIGKTGFNVNPIYLPERQLIPEQPAKINS
jgi:hypothetical protein